MDSAARSARRQGQVRHHHGLVRRRLNMIEWQKHIEARLRRQDTPTSPWPSCAPATTCRRAAFDETTTILMLANPDVKLIMAICSPAVPR